MLVSLALVVFGSSIAVFFSNEWHALFKKVFAIPGVKLFMPLLIVSCFIEKYALNEYWLLTGLQALITHFIRFCAAVLPFQTGALHISKIIYLFLFACLPAWILCFREKRKELDPMWPKPYRIGVALWVILAFLLTIN